MTMETYETPNPLKLDLQFFADGGDNPDDGGGQGDNPQDTTPNQNGDNTPHEDNKSGDAHKQDNMIPKTRFDEVNEQMKQFKQQVEEFQQQQENQKLEDQKKRGEFEQLYEETKGDLDKYKGDYEQTSQRVEQLEGVIQGLVEQQMSDIPEDMQDIIPDGMTPEQKLAWIGNAKAKGLFGSNVNPREDQPLGDNTNDNNEQHSDVSKMSAMELFMSAYGRKE